jgi:hypothetical protein
VGELNPGGLRQGKVELFLKVLIHHVNQAIAEPPEEKQRTDQHEGYEMAFAIFGSEQGRF